jgi:hypothetical protein
MNDLCVSVLCDGWLGSRGLASGRACDAAVWPGECPVGQRQTHQQARPLHPTVEIDNYVYENDIYIYVYMFSKAYIILYYRGRILTMQMMAPFYLFTSLCVSVLGLCVCISLSLFTSLFSPLLVCLCVCVCAVCRYCVTPLSHNVGIVCWVPHCDTLHALIRDYRDSRKVRL